MATATDSAINADWKEGAPRKGMNVDNFGVRWTGTFRPPQTGTYRLALIGTIKFELYLDDSLVTRSFYPTHDGEYPDPRLNQTEPMQLQGGHDYKIRVIGRETYGEAQLQLLWSTPHEALAGEAEAIAKQADAVIMFLGLTARLEGEEMRVQVPGFRGGDRTSIDLPEPQETAARAHRGARQADRAWCCSTAARSR